MENIDMSNQPKTSDFFVVPNIKFDIDKMRNDLEKILEVKNFNSLGIKSFGAIPINQIPGDKSSVEGHNVRGTYRTIPDESGKEAKRDKAIDESKYTELLPEFRGTYFEEIFDTIRKRFREFCLKNLDQHLVGIGIQSQDFIFQLLRIKDVEW